MAGSRGEFTFAGAFDDSFDDYSQQLAHRLPGAVVNPLRDPLAPDTGDDAPFYGTVGAFRASRALVSPLGPWDPDYSGNLPVNQQPVIPNVDPWDE